MTKSKQALLAYRKRLYYAFIVCFGVGGACTVSWVFTFSPSFTEQADSAADKNSAGPLVFGLVVLIVAAALDALFVLEFRRRKRRLMRRSDLTVGIPLASWALWTVSVIVGFWSFIVLSDPVTRPEVGALFSTVWLIAMPAIAAKTIPTT